MVSRIPQPGYNICLISYAPYVGFWHTFSKLRFFALKLFIRIKFKSVEGCAQNLISKIGNTYDIQKFTSHKKPK